MPAHFLIASNLIQMKNLAGLKKYAIWFIPLTFCGILFFQSCSEKEEVNPFDETIPGQDTVNFQISNPDPNTIAGLFVNIFHPTCANVACHDGTFEPDFRTIESTYNTMVYQLPIKNDGNYEFRVHPGRPDQSVLMARIDGTINPPMPFQLEPDSDWLINKEEYIQNIRNWINNGARDIMGNLPAETPLPRPGFRGMLAFQNDGLLNRQKDRAAVVVPSEFDSLHLFFSVTHSEMDVRNFNENSIRLNPEMNGFESATSRELEVLNVPLTGRGLYGDLEEYYHRFSIWPPDYFGEEDQMYLRLYFGESGQPVTEIPTNEASYEIKSYLSLVLSQ